MIYLYTGEGAGKTCNALGLALRSLGHGHIVVIMQFMKWWDKTGEGKFNHSNYHIFLGGRKGWIGKDNLTKEDKEQAENFLREAYLKLCEFKPDLLILDEINLAVAWGLLDEKEVIDILDVIQKKHPNIDIVMTGRYATKGLIDRADFVNEIIEIKSPKEMISEKGIQW